MSAAPVRVLIVDDEPPIRKLLRMGLTAQGYQVLEAPDGATALNLIAEKPDLVILDLGLPDMEGLDLLRSIRAQNERVPIVVLSSRGDEAAKVQALDIGADDYVTKPFGTDELVARIRAVLRRQADVSAGEPVIRTGDLEIDLARRSVTVGGRVVKLTPTEYELLRYLALHAGKPVTHTTLLRQVWGEYAVGDKYNTRYVVAQIRKKLGDDPANPRYIVNEPGVGYRLTAPDGFG